tara:strand:+ start:939 stop:1205 length:267 start_codon:yes stop_codon:yes gene_type:complete
VHGNDCRELLEAVIEQAVHDRRTAVSRSLVDARGRLLPCATVKVRDRHGLTYALESFFYGGGLEIILEELGYKINPDLIRSKSEEPYE